VTKSHFHSQNVKPKSDTCPKYGRSQRHVVSPSST